MTHDDAHTGGSERAGGVTNVPPGAETSLHQHPQNNIVSLLNKMYMNVQWRPITVMHDLHTINSPA